jgi:hypothetical protein
MSNKKETPVSWLELEIKKFYSVITREYLLILINQALEMESKKQQKYDEMLAMLEAFALMSEVIGMGKSIMAEQLIKEAKEL